MAERCVQLTPDRELEFDFTLPQQYERTLKIKNITSSYVSFKVKTTAPKAYLVRPSNDVLAPGAEASIQILLQPNAPRDAPHRFLVQAAPIQGRENLTKEGWAALGKEGIYEQRLSVVEKAGSGEKDLQSKYDELIAYVMKSEKELAELKRQNEKAQGKGDFGTGFALWHVFLAMIISVVLTKLPQYIPQ